MPAITANALIAKLKLEKHPEGGYFKQLYKSPEIILRDRESLRTTGTSILYLLKGKDFSAWHMLRSDQTWIYNSGSNIIIYILDPITEKIVTIKIGNEIEQEDAKFQHTIPANTWFCAEVEEKHSFSLVSCVVNPGFEYNDFIPANRDELINLYPQHEGIIKLFTKSVSRYARNIIADCKEAVKIYKKEPALRIYEETKCSKTGEIEFIVHVVGKNLFPKFSAALLIQDEAVLNNFSKYDKNRILRAALGYVDSAHCRILAKNFTRDHGLVYSLEYIGNGQRYVKNIQVSELNRYISVEALSKEDVYTLAYDLARIKKLNFTEEMST